MNIFKSKLITLSAIALAAGITTASAKDTITVAMQLEPPHLDPTSAAAGAIDNVVYSNIFEGIAPLKIDRFFSGTKPISIVGKIDINSSLLI